MSDLVDVLITLALTLVITAAILLWGRSAHRAP
jgi:hypothetical protein